jgi:hypothetical protein
MWIDSMLVANTKWVGGSGGPRTGAAAPRARARKKSILAAGLALAFCCISFSGHSEESADNLVPIGSIEQLVDGGDGEHANGHRISLWRAGNKLVGELTCWESSIEGHRGDFKDGSIDPKTMNMQFQVTVKWNNPPEPLRTALFTGRLRGAFLEGSLKWIGEAAEGRGENSVEKCKLPKNIRIMLFSFRTTEDWEKAEPWARSIGETLQ